MEKKKIAMIGGFLLGSLLSALGGSAIAEIIIAGSVLAIVLLFFME